MPRPQLSNEQAWDMVSLLLRWHRHEPPDHDRPMVMCSCGLTATACEILAAGRDSGILPPLAHMWSRLETDRGGAT